MTQSRTTLTVNARDITIDVAPETPLLWVLREQLALTGTKFGCGASQCGACTVLVNGSPIRSCVTPVSAIGAQSVHTIEGVRDGEDARIANALHDAWVAHGVPQCGYCQSGMLMSALALLKINRNPDDDDIDTAFAGHICRCGSYQRLRAAVHTAAASIRLAGTDPDRDSAIIPEADSPRP